MGGHTTTQRAHTKNLSSFAFCGSMGSGRFKNDYENYRTIRHATCVVDCHEELSSIHVGYVFRIRRRIHYRAKKSLIVQALRM